MNDNCSKEVPDPRAEEIFLNALEIKKEKARKAYINKACRGDARLLDVVNTFIHDHECATNLFRETAQGLAQAEDLLSDDLAEASLSIGPYRIVKLLGEGGSGTVYEARQDAPFRRSVALKILKVSTDALRFVTLFKAEQQTLALMEHPNIARAIDAGTTSDGRPYFVMDLVHGERITDYCTKNALKVAERLHLMREVCSAVQHAHNKGIIHRDLKPSNILVTLVDGAPVPKVIDFGIARAVARQTEPDGNSSAGNQWLGTPAYMSPEQCRDSADIDTRSDVYSLGVVLYELIAGRPPFDYGDIMRAGQEEIFRRIRDEVAPPPSVFCTERNLRASGDLNCIVLKAMEKDREKRYTTVQAFSADIGRFLRGEPVEAHVPGRFYRLRKLISRNYLASTTIAVAALALAAGCTTSTLLYLRAKAAEHEQAQLRADSEEREHVTKAAILLMQRRPSEADAELRKMGGTLTQPSLEATNVFRQLGTWSAMNGDWKTSADRWLALSRVNRFDDSDMTDNATRDLIPIAPTLVTIGDFERYHAFQQLLISRLGRTTNPVAAEQVLKICLQTYVSKEMMAELAPVASVAENSLSADKNESPHNYLEAWRCVALALWHYRSGDTEKAIDWCNRALLWHDDHIAREMQIHIIRAMAEIAEGDATSAKVDLDMARTAISKRFTTPLDFGSDGNWHDWLEARILLGEAEKIRTYSASGD